MPSALHTIERVCKECSAPVLLRILRDIDRKWFCSMACRSRFNRRVAPNVAIDEIRACIWCKHSFRADRPRQIYCCKSCQTSAATRRYDESAPTVEKFMGRLLRTGNRKHISAKYLVEMFEMQGGRCAVTGEPMTILQRQGRVLTNASLDRIDSTRGYERDNIQLVCFIVNLMKHSMTMDELFMWCSKVVEGQNAKSLCKTA